MRHESETTHIKYSKGHKYQLKEDAWFKTTFVGFDTETDYLRIYEDGWLHVKKGYAWDGPSGPTFDTRSALRGSLVHDPLYELIRKEIIPRDRRIDADEEAKLRWLADGMWRIRVWIWTKVLNKHATAAAHPDRKRKIYTAP